MWWESDFGGGIRVEGEVKSFVRRKREGSNLEKGLWGAEKTIWREGVIWRGWIGGIVHGRPRRSSWTWIRFEGEVELFVKGGREGGDLECGYLERVDWRYLSMVLASETSKGSSGWSSANPASMNCFFTTPSSTYMLYLHERKPKPKLHWSGRN